jgi:hypothetical protein
MIYILRHQIGETHTNCLSELGVRDAYRVAKVLEDKTQNKNKHIYTMMPTSHGKHVRPIETASIVCSATKRCLNILDEVFPDKNDIEIDHIIVWDHRGIPKILKKYFENASFVWEDDNYDGCLLIYKNGTWEFVSDYFHRDNMFKQVCSCFSCIFGSRSVQTGR